MARLTQAEFAATKIKVAKINARAAKRGFTGRFDVTGELVTVIETHAPNGYEYDFPRRVTYVDAQITGEAPKYEGWTFLARVDLLPVLDKSETQSDAIKNGAFTLAIAPGVENLDRTLVKPGACEHCNTSRYRKNTYLVGHEDGRVLNVGASCIKDFLGHDVSFTWIDTEKAEREAFDGFSGQGEITYRVSDILRLATAAVNTLGFVPTSAYQGVPTRQRVDEALNPANVRGQGPAADEARRQAREIAKVAREIDDSYIDSMLAFLTAEGEDGLGNSDYAQNMRAIASAEFITPKQIGLLASAPQAYNRHLGKVAEREAKVTSEWIGVLDEKIVYTITIEMIRPVDSDFGTRYLVAGRTEAGEVVKTFTTAAWVDQIDVKEAATVQATVKAHETYEGHKDTLVTRAKMIEKVSA